jgi:hypothetical protein
VYHRRAVSLALVGLLVWVTGCYNYTPIGPSQVGYYGKVRVSTIDGLERSRNRDGRRYYCPGCHRSWLFRGSRA